MKYLNQDQLSSFFKTVRQSNSLRDEVAFSLMLFLGLRVGELVKIRIEDINFQSKQIEIRGLKNGRTRTYSLDARLWRKLLKFTQNSRSTAISWLFPSRAYAGQPITTAALWRMFKIYAEKAGLESRYSIHSLRHSCAVTLALSGATPFDIQSWLRHRTINSTEIYFQEIRELEVEQLASGTFAQYL